MATWIYRCEKCEITFAVEVEGGAKAPDVATCPECGDAGAVKQFELPQPSGGCGCGGGSCC
jgi:putative FmdB family regulatory protein